MLRIAGIINFILSLGHLASLIRARQVFEAGGVGKEMAELSQIHPSLPYLLTVMVAIVLFVFGLYAFSADGRIRKLPLLKPVIFGIASLFILRTFMGIAEMIFRGGVHIPLELCYSSGSLAIGLLYLLGGLKKWRKIQD